MVHSFDTGIAEKYGILEALLLQNIYFWLEKNKAEGRNFHDGKYWTYNSTKVLGECFSYASERQIKHALKKLREEGILETGNYNKNAMDRTLWYTLTEKGYALFCLENTDSTNLSNAKDESESSIVQNETMDGTNLSNAKDGFVQAIPDNNTNNNPDNNTDFYDTSTPKSQERKNCQQKRIEKPKERTYADKTNIQGYRNRGKSNNRFLNFEQHNYTSEQYKEMEQLLLAKTERYLNSHKKLISEGESV